MKLSRIRLQNYRNISFLDLPLDGLTQFFVGKNAQGKTNLLEAVGLLTALRSFRTQEMGTLVRHDSIESKLAFDIRDESSGTVEVWITLRRRGKEVVVDGEKIQRFRDFIGRFPVVVLCSQDIQLLRGSPGVRRRWMNLLLSSASSDYYDGLREFHKLLNERNSLLKSNNRSEEMDVYEKMLAEKSFQLHTARVTAVSKLDSFLKNRYSLISPDEEYPELKYKPDSEGGSVDDYLRLFQNCRDRDFLLKSTQRGPHRDDLSIQLQSRKAREFASEGQQRSLIISLRLAQLEYLHQSSGERPVLLADDVLGELDSVREDRFWSAVGETVQVIATGTEVPISESRGNWQVFEVNKGTFTKVS